MIRLDNNINCVSNKCCGCGLCVNKCPYKAIEFKENEEGFLYPVVLKEKCKNCGVCKSYCPVLSDIEKNKEQYQEKCYMGISKNKGIYKRSASGGFATVLSNYIIKSLKGVVYGCNLDEDGNVKHIRVDIVENLPKLQDSKYVQSEIVGIFDAIKEDLKNKKVLFIGTPCQVDAIKKYLNKEELENLLTCDLVCHGVPSPILFKRYIHYLSKKYKMNIKNYRFRNKTKFDKCGFRGKISTEKKCKYIFTDNDLYYSDFLEEKNFRLSCYQCKYKENKRVGDFTIGDVNTWEKYYDFYPELASSLIIVNSVKAEKIFSKIRDDIKYREISLEDEKKINKALSRQTQYPEERNTIYQKYKNLAKYESNLINNISKKQKIKNTLKIIIPFKIRIKIKKMKRKMRHYE